MEGENVPFSVEDNNELYELLNDLDAYLGHSLISEPTEGLAKRMLKVITWPGAN